MAYGVILKHLEVDKITWGGHFLKKNTCSIFGRKEGRGALYLTGVENTATSTSKFEAVMALFDTTSLLE
jgi:hypothetical protein